MESISGAGLIVVLGSPNGDDGSLPAMARGRLDLGLRLYRERAAFGWRLLPTGGFGEHFNRADEPHAAYAARYLEAEGAGPGAIAGLALSSFTLDDALKARPFAEALGVRRLAVVTSDFHLDRAAFAFRRVFPDFLLEFFGAPYLDSCPAEEAARLAAHERGALARMAAAAVSGPSGAPA